MTDKLVFPEVGASTRNTPCVAAEPTHCGALAASCPSETQLQDARNYLLLAIQMINNHVASATYTKDSIQTVCDRDGVGGCANTRHA